MDKINEKIDLLKDDMVSSIQDILRIKSISGEKEGNAPFGKGTADALEYALKLAERLGFKTVNLDNYVGYAEYGEGEEYVAVLGHLDVVPEGDGWNYPPYGAEIHDGNLYARGAMDDKGPTIACLYSLKAIVDAGLTMSKKVRVIFGLDEETGSGKDTEHYLKYEKPPVLGFTPDAEYPIINGEKGITIFNLVKDFKNDYEGETKIQYVKGGDRSNIVPPYAEAGIKADLKGEIIDKCESFCERTGYDLKAEEKDDMVIIKSKGIAAHGSTPHLGKNAIMQLLSFLDELNLGKSDLTDYIAFLNKYIGMETDGESFGIGMEDKVSGKLSFNVGVIDFSRDLGKVILNVRYPVTCKYEDMMTGINDRIANTGIRIENMTHQKSLYYPEDHKLVKILQKVYEDQTGNEPKLLSIGGGTYAKEMPNVVGFGPIFPGEPDVDHQANEFIKVEHIVLNAKIYAHAIYELAR
ncbi:dipeptidase PepV [Clostridium felsineum]|uniref:Dipeptidase n=1 Tax=Clostridium felsineum TaxID=36839 RepID=A0A1S8KZ57_9CLOT|nr:dipeptidase PepV [Clostridium felsineum]URZ07735.1 Putative dipeptidase [Clostridium felsineum]URZ12766.1 Putative dipeptidase [Clostridium felsineum]